MPRRRNGDLAAKAESESKIDRLMENEQRIQRAIGLLDRTREHSAHNKLNTKNKFFFKLKSLSHSSSAIWVTFRKL